MRPSRRIIVFSLIIAQNDRDCRACNCITNGTDGASEAERMSERKGGRGIETAILACETGLCSSRALMTKKYVLART